MKLALLGLHKQAVLEETLEDHTDVCNMFLEALGKNVNIIQINRDRCKKKSCSTSFIVPTPGRLVRRKGIMRYSK